MGDIINIFRKKSDDKLLVDEKNKKVTSLSSLYKDQIIKDQKYAERLGRIRESLSKINELMQELKSKYEV